MSAKILPHERWQDKLKVALINKDSKSVFDAIENLPDFDLIENNNEKLEALQIASELISQGIALMQDEQRSVMGQIIKIRHTRKFFN